MIKGHVATAAEPAKDARWVSCASAARLVGVSRQAIHDRLQRGTIPSMPEMRFGKQKRVLVRPCDCVKQFAPGRPTIRPFDVKEISQVQFPDRFAVLFAREDSIYKDMGADVWDANRDALKFPGGRPCVAHPPCRSWGKVRGLAKPRPGERMLAPWAISIIQGNGGVLEHPKGSGLWGALGLPLPGEFPDMFGGYTIGIDQFDFGHVAHKATYLYIVGVHPRDLPAIPQPVKGKNAGRSIMGDVAGTQCCTPYMREYTPPKLAAWLCKVAGLAGKQAKTRELTC